MARPKKADEQKQLAPAMQPHPQANLLAQAAAAIPAPVAAVPPPIMNNGDRSIDVPNFIKVRDTVCTNRFPWPFSPTISPPQHQAPPTTVDRHPPGQQLQPGTPYHRCTTHPQTFNSGSDFWRRQRYHNLAAP